jgi:hypothetical protein
VQLGENVVAVDLDPTFARISLHSYAFVTLVRYPMPSRKMSKW